MTDKPRKCLGWRGRLFGHKFTKTLFFAAVTLDEGFCYRCGYRP